MFLGGLCDAFFDVWPYMVKIRLLQSGYSAPTVQAAAKTLVRIFHDRSPSSSESDAWNREKHNQTKNQDAFDHIVEIPFAIL